jgi:hypothetical protein
MVKLRSAILAGVATLAVAGAAEAQAPDAHTAEAQVMSVPLPDGSTARIRYFGAVEPQVTVAMTPPPAIPDFDFYECYDAFGYFGHYSPCFRHRWRGGYDGHHSHHGAKVAAATPPGNVVGPQGMPPQFVVEGDQPRGSRYHYILISTAPDGRPCVQRTEWTSRGRDREPLVTRTDTGEGCAAMPASAALSAPAPVEVEIVPKPAH